MFCSRRLCNVARGIAFNKSREFDIALPSSTFHTLGHGNFENNSTIKNVPNLYAMRRYKHDKKKSKEEIDDESTDKDKDEEFETDELSTSKVITAKVKSMRLDNYCKVVFGISRTKIEQSFYQSKIRINGQRAQKKSYEVAIGDEVDLFRSQYKETNFIVVSRTVLLSGKVVDDNIVIKVALDKCLIIEEYKD